MVSKRWKISTLILLLLLLLSLLLCVLDLFQQKLSPPRIGSNQSISDTEEEGKKYIYDGEDGGGGGEGRRGLIYLGSYSLTRKLPIFAVHGITNHSYLRVLVGEIYENGFWRMLDEPSALKYSGENIEQQVTSYLVSIPVSFQIIPIINLSGFIPSINNPLKLDIPRSVNALYYADQIIFLVEGRLSEGYGITYMNYLFDEKALLAARPILDERYLHVPSDLMKHLELLALHIIMQYDAKEPYEKLRAIEEYLKTNYEYSEEYNPPPKDYDPVLWFLFEERRGVCVHFNSAFVLLARSLNIPARLVAGYYIDPSVEYQTVYSNQFHAYAEVPFEGFGWITFDATGYKEKENKRSIDNGSYIRNGRINTITEIECFDRVGVKGSKFHVRGRVLDEYGFKVSGLLVEIYLKRSKEDTFEKSLPVGRGSVENGVFDIVCEIPLYIGVGEYHIIARTYGDERYSGSESDPQISIVADTYISVESPKKVIVGRNFILSGFLKEKKSNIPVVNETIIITIGSNTYKTITNSEGRFSISCLVNKPGSYVILVEFKGSKYHLASSTERDLRVLSLNVTPMTKNPLIRGEDAYIYGRVHAEDLPGDNEIVMVSLDGVRIAEAVTDSNGYFSVIFRIPQNYTLGPSQLDYFLMSGECSVSQVVKIVARTRMIASSPRSIESDKPFNITIILLNDLLQPIPMAAVLLNYSCQNRDFSMRTVTNMSGMALFNMSLFATTMENVTYIAYFPGGDLYLGTLFKGYFMVIPQSQSAMLLNATNLVFLAVTACSLLAVLLFLNKRRWKKKSKEQPESIHSTIEARVPPVMANIVKVSIYFPEIKDPFPLVWGVNEELIVRLKTEDSNGAPIVGETLKLSIDGEQDIYLRTQINGEAETRIIFKNKGIHRLKAYLETGGQVSSAETEIKIVDYREEIVELFNMFLEAALSRFQRINKVMTPREIQAELSTQINQAKHMYLEDLISIFEVADYSLHPITRREYEQFFLAKLNLER